MCEDKKELCFNIDKKLWDTLAKMEEKGEVRPEEVIELGIAMHHTVGKNKG
ncbi:MAG: hypothetical protein ACOCTT_03035 [archaeon]